jgi:hypothetical protein
MPVIIRETMGANSPTGMVRFIRVVKYDTRRQKFTIDLPEWIKDEIGQSSVMSDTQGGAEQEYNRVCQEYENTIRYSRKVIAYTVLMSGSVMENLECIKKWEDFDFLKKETMALGIGYIILDEIKIGGTATYKDMHGDRYIPDDRSKIIPWSQSAEEFFSQTQKGLQALMLKIEEFFSDETKVLKKIQTTQNLLPLPKY